VASLRTLPPLTPKPNQPTTNQSNTPHPQISIVSLGNSIQAYFSLAGSQQVYAGTTPSLVTPLSARTFGTWTALSSIIRLYGAYHIDNPAVYEITLWTFGIAFGHFALEWLVYGTTKLGKGLAGPLVVSTVTASWMVVQWEGYTR
jgi:hypothetical protein